MSRTKTSLVRKAAFAGLAAFCVSSVTFAQAAAPTADTHVYVNVMVLNGVKYVQINDLSGKTYAVVRADKGTSIVLPVKVDAQNDVRSAQRSALMSTGAISSAAQTVYQDSTITVTAVPQTNGTTQFNFINSGSCPTWGCGGGGSS